MNQVALNNPLFSTGNELTPGVKYDFKFKDYAPWVFRHLREKFHVDAADYMVSESGSLCVLVCFQAVNSFLTGKSIPPPSLPPVASRCR